MSWETVRSGRVDLYSEVTLSIVNGSAQVRLAAALLDRLGWKIRDKVHLYVGRGEHEGRMRIDRQPPCERTLSSLAYKSGSGRVVLGRVAGMPDKLRSCVVDHELRDEGVEFVLPWAANSEVKFSQTADVRPWTQDEDARLRALFVTSVPITEVAGTLGRSVRSVESRAYGTLKMTRRDRVAPVTPPVDDEVARFIAEKGVTKCPPAHVAHTEQGPKLSAMPGDLVRDPETGKLRRVG